MNPRKVLSFFFFILFPIAVSILFSAHSAYGYWVWSPEKGEFINPDGVNQGTTEEEFDFAMKLYKEKNLKQAAEKFEEILKKYPNVPLASEAQYRLGLIAEEQGDYLKAYKGYKHLVETYPQSERFSEVIEREFRIGNLFLSGKKGKLMGLEILPSLPQAADVFQNIVKFAPFSEFGDKAQFHLGLTYKQMGKYEEAVEAFQGVIDKYPRSPLVAQARYQLAETSFDRSASEFRDQRALDEASKQVDQFLDRFPDTEASEKAAKLRQAIDEKNAEKNYQIAVYYEKDHYVQSAVIYYQDVANRYPKTQWGIKAIEKLKVLKNPTEYHSEQDKALAEKIHAVEKQLKDVKEDNKDEIKRLQAELRKLKDQQKALQGKEREGLESLAKDIKRREEELKEKFKNLERKKKDMKDNKSEDFKRAMDRWYASLVEERETLEMEKKQLNEWRSELGLTGKISLLEFLPFLGEPPTAIQKIRQIEAKRLYKISLEKAELLTEKEGLYKRYSEYSVLLDQTLGVAPAAVTPVPVSEKAKSGAQTREKEGPIQVPSIAGRDDWKALLDAGGDQFKLEKQKLSDTHAKILVLETELQGKLTEYEKTYGKPAWLEALNISSEWIGNSAGALARVVNPFNWMDRGIEELDTKELLELQMHLKEQAATEQNLVDTLSHAFDAEMAFKEQQEIMKQLESKDQIDPEELRKSIKNLERDIRVRYQEIQDKHLAKKEKLAELEALLGKSQKESSGWEKTQKAVAFPAVSLYRFGKSFLFGMENKDEKITREASQTAARSSSADLIRKLKEDIELDSLLIDAKNEEIMKLRHELDIMKAKASLAGGYKFRSAFVEVPYQFIGEAIESARRIVPKKDRREVLLERMNEESAKLETLRNRLAEIDKRLKEMPVPAPIPAKAEKSKDQTEPAGDEIPAQVKLKKQIQDLDEQLQIEKNIFERQKALLQSQLSTFMGKEIPVEEAAKPSKVRSADTVMDAQPESKSDAVSAKPQSKKDLKKLKEAKEELLELIRKEDRLETEESVILEKRIEQIDRVIGSLFSKADKQDLLTERQRMEERISQIKTRRSFLLKEKERFEPVKTGTVA